MDVAALAGFAEAGPFGVPVCVESTDGFAAVFGRPVALPGGPGRLASAAAAFFAQGGRRVWVVRCGDAATAAARFPLPGVIAVLRGDASPDDDRLRPAALAARSAGTFADDQRIATAVRRERIVVAPLADSTGVRITAADGDVAAGRLVELPLLRDGVAARRIGVLTGPNAVTGVFRLASSLTVTEAPALADDLAGHVGELARADGPRRTPAARGSRSRSRPARRRPPPSAGSCASIPCPCARRCRRARCAAARAAHLGARRRRLGAARRRRRGRASWSAGRRSTSTAIPPASCRRASAPSSRSSCPAARSPTAPTGA